MASNERSIFNLQLSDEKTLDFASEHDALSAKNICQSQGIIQCCSNIIIERDFDWRITNTDHVYYSLRCKKNSFVWDQKEHYYPKKYAFLGCPKPCLGYESYRKYCRNRKIKNFFKLLSSTLKTPFIFFRSLGSKVQFTMVILIILVLIYCLFGPDMTLKLINAFSKR